MVTKPDVMLNIGCTQDHNPEEENLKSKNLDCFYIISKKIFKKKVILMYLWSKKFHQMTDFLFLKKHTGIVLYIGFCLVHAGLYQIEGARHCNFTLCLALYSCLICLASSNQISVDPQLSNNIRLSRWSKDEHSESTCLLSEKKTNKTKPAKTCPFTTLTTP